VFLARLLAEADAIQRPPNSKLVSSIAALKKEECKKNAEVHSNCGVDPMALVLSLRRLTRPDALMFVDATQAEHWAAEAFTVHQPRTYFNSTNNQAMDWSVPAAWGAHRAQAGRQAVAL